MINATLIKAYAKELGIDEIYITSAQPFADAAEKILEQKNAKLYLSTEHWQKRNIGEFCNVQSVLPQARAIIAACQCYLTDEKSDLSEPGNPHGLIARYTWRNHYLDLKKKLEKLGQLIRQKISVSYYASSNGPVAEKPIAQRSGLGYYGKHSIIINQLFGSWIVLGTLIIDIEIEPDRPLTIDCGDCQKCIEMCPTKAIIAPYIIDRRRCIQALTNWYGIIPQDIVRVWGNRLYGCTICQDVCPANEHVEARAPRTNVGTIGQSLPLFEILSMEESAYRKKYACNQITANWINFKAIRRNAIIALGHIKDKAALPILQKLSRDNDDVMAKTAQWACTYFDS
jgi:epoxyqueuosine reductase